MPLTPSEILHKEFDSKFRGYDPDQVNDFLDVIVADFEKLTLENQTLTSKMADMQDKLNYFQQLQDSLNNSIVVAQEAAERLKQNARKEAELILYEAEREADKLYEESADRSKRLLQETENLRRYSLEFRDRLINMVEAQLSLINKDEYKDLFEASQLEAEQQATKLDLEGTVKDKVDHIESQTYTSGEGTLEALDIDFQQVPIFDQDDYNTDLANEDQAEPSFAQAHGQADLDPGMDQDPFYGDDVLNQVEPENAGPESVLGRTIRIDLPS
ncbi:TPA: DivIVA domain-containing protein [Streptococcus suis]